MTLQIKSEIGRLRQVLMHEPGLEVDQMIPSMMEELLFDDILYGERAREEHRRFRRILQMLSIEVFEAQDLLREVLENPEGWAWLRQKIIPLLAADVLDRLDAMEAEEKTQALVGGLRQERPYSLGDLEEFFSIPPIPNWCFQRDPQVVVGGGVIFAAMASGARLREALLSQTIFRFHPRFSSSPILFDPLHEELSRPLFLGFQRPYLEGGDLLVLSEDVIAVGFSQRTNDIAIHHLARSLSRKEGGPRWLVVVELPKKRAYMHLDTLITPVDRDACLLYGPVLLPGGREEAAIYEIDLHTSDLLPSRQSSFLAALQRRGLFYEPILCGGKDPVHQQREQWTDGANVFALAPGVITLYAQNIYTAEALQKQGFQILEAEDLLLGRSELSLKSHQRTCILLSSHEISRARGGPHCLTHPLVRDLA